MRNMRYWAILVVVLIIFVSMLYIMPTNIIDATQLLQGTAYIHCSQYSGNATTIDNGSGKIVVVPTSLTNTQLSNCVDVKGVDIKFEVDSYTAVAQLLDDLSVKVYDKQTMGKVISIYGYSNRISGGIVVDGRLINIHIAYNSGTVTIGSPIILGSF